MKTRHLSIQVCRLLTAILSFIFVSAIQAQPTQVPALPIMEHVPTTEDSVPWLHYQTLQRPLDLDAYGFVEEEYFISGHAKVYDWGPADAEQLEVLYEDAPYKTRVLIRRPESPDAFSGNVYVEVMNPARTYDLNIFFSYMKDRMLNNGDAWIGVTSYSSSIAGLQRYDLPRYASLHFNNPAPVEESACSPGVAEPSEDGLRFDMLSQLARMLKSDNELNPLLDFDVDYIYMVNHIGGGGNYQASVAREHRQPDGGPIYDGYIIKTGSGANALNNCGSGPEAGDPRDIHGELTGAPVIQIKMEGDVPGDYRRPDSDDPNDTYRLYEVPGTAHADTWPYDGLPNTDHLRRMIDYANWDERGVVTDLYPYAYPCNVDGISMNDFPIPYVVQGVLANLDAYKREGIPMPSFERIQTYGELGRTPVAKDQHGNAMGGVRTVWVDAPTATWYVHTPGDFGTCRHIGYQDKWDFGRMEAVYGSYANWAAQANASIDRMVANRVVTADMGEQIRAEMIRGSSTDIPYVRLQGVDTDRIPTSHGDLVIKPIGHASFVMQWNGKTIYVDPTGGAGNYVNIPRPDLVLVTDIHGDHLDANTLSNIGYVHMVGPQAVADQAGNASSLFTTILANGETAPAISIPDLQIEAVPMYNVTEDRLNFHPPGRGNGYVLTFGDKRVYIAGDTEATPEMLALEDIDAAFIPMNLPYTMTVEMAAEAVRTFRPDIVYPYHYRGSDVAEFERLVGNRSEVRLLDWY